MFPTMGDSPHVWLAVFPFAPCDSVLLRTQLVPVVGGVLFANISMWQLIGFAAGAEWLDLMGLCGLILYVGFFY